MTHVHYKFSSKLNYNTVVFDGPNITLSELKRLIMTREKLRANDCDLQITNAQTKEEYTDDESPIPKGASVIVRRVPSSGVRSSSSAKNIVRSDAFKYSFGAFRPPMDDQKTTGVLPFFSKMANLANVDVSEEDKIKVMMNQSCYDNTNYKRHGAALPANYTCYRCGSIGHHIRNCPVSSDKNAEPSLKIKKSTGIPRSFMVEVDDPTIKGAMLTNTGLYAIPTIDAEAYAVGKKKSSPQRQQTKEPADNPIPDELLCLICHDLLSDAVVIPCCGNSYCDDCIRSALLDSEDHVCPTCNQSDVSPDTLIANKFLRQAVNTFKKEQVHTQSFNKTPSTSLSQNSTPRPSLAPTPPSVHSQSQPQKLQAADTPITGSDSTPSGPSPSLVVKSHDEPPDKETEVKTNIALAAAAPPAVQVSKANPTETHSQPIPLVNLVKQTAVADTSNSGSSSQSGQTPSWDKSTSAAPSEGWTTIRSTHHPTSSSTTYSPTQSPGITHSHIQTYLAVQQQQPLSSYPPGYSTTTPQWTPGPSPLRAPIPSFASSSIPAPVPIEWFMYHRRNKERTPHRESSYGSSSQSYKSKSLRSSSRSPSHSRSQSRSRPHSPHSSHRGLSSRSHSSHSYSYGYKRSPTPSSSSSPRSHHHSSSKSPSDHRKNCHHGQHHSRKSTSSSSSSSRRKGERSYTSGSSRGKGPELSLYTYQRWKQDYKEWCDKYFNSYVNHFQQLPPPFLAPPPQQHWSSHHTTGHSSPSSNSRSPPSQSSSESSSTPSQMSSDSHSTPSTSHSNSHSTPTESSSESSGPSQESSKVSQHRNVEKNQNEERECKRHNNENCNVLKPASKKTDKHLKSKGNDRKRKEPKISDKKKEIKRWEEEKRHKVKANQEAGSIDANRSRQVGRTRSQHSWSDKNRTRKNEETQRNQGGNIFTEPSPSLETDISPKVFRREKQKKAVWKPQPITEEDVWEGGVKVKPQKRISININMDVKKNVAITNKQEADAKSNEAIQDFEEKLHSQTDNDMNKKESELEEKKPEEMKDVKNDSWEIFAQDEAVGGEDSLLWECALTGVEEEGIKAGDEASVKEEKVDSQEQGKSTFELQSNRDHNERPNTGLDHIGSEVGRWQSVSGEEQQKSMTGIKCLEYIESRSLEKHKELVQVSHSRYEREVFEPEKPAKVSTNYREREPKRMRLVEKEKDEKIENSVDRRLVPSSGKEITDRTFDFDRKGKKMTEREMDRERESRKQHKSNCEERGCQKERESHSTLYRKYSSGPSQAFTSIVEVGTKSRDRNQEEDKNREKHTRQSKINIDSEWRGKTQEYNHHTSHKDPTLGQYSSWTSLSSHPQDSPGWSGQNWTDKGQRPATPMAESSLGMTSDTENTKQRAIDDRREERGAKVRELDRQTRDDKGQADPERLCCSSGIGSSTSLHNGMNEQRRDKKKQKSHKREQRHSIADVMKKSRKKNKHGEQQ